MIRDSGHSAVIPAKAGIQFFFYCFSKNKSEELDSRLRGNDEREAMLSAMIRAPYGKRMRATTGK